MDWRLLKLLYHSIPWHLLLPFFLVLLSASTVCYMVQMNRYAYAQLKEQYRQNIDHEVQWGKLILEYNTLTAYYNIEKIVEQKFHMQFPFEKNILVIQP